MYKRNLSRGCYQNLYKKSVYKTWSTKQNYIRQRSKIYNSLLESIFSGIRGLRSNINSMLSIDRQIDKNIKLDTRIVFKALY